MIARLRGRVLEQLEDGVVLDVNGVGYMVYCPTRVLATLGRGGDLVDLFIETQVREDAISLFGFAQAAERSWFKALQAVQGVGARSALAILGVHDADRLATAIAVQDKAALARAPGVGPKLAARICIELKDKAATMAASRDVPTSLGGGAVVVPSGPLDDALSALTNLGYGRSEAFAALQSVRATQPEDAGLQQLLGAALRELAR
ncbi:MAG TPA: Holliday junction branch migration protein RuvA [Geminicoccus sp.]|uniref:Holliday junction branch migration protein RuvA n=1 Tax=Geminicoccus sp. TaxID=2024832 RepID=UPI002E31161C|nr:Holliday junction branch migration protein RuvA [Geminicoccus sp.]HEX2528086.1 Holliday junction branch migration protein RuvA [Geminicoccus sp.]